MPQLEIRDLTHTFHSGGGVRHINLSLDDGKMLVLLGPSGCGKTTLLRTIAGLLRPATGTVLLDGEDITGLPPEKRGFGMVFQTWALFPSMTVVKNVEFGLRMRGVDQPQRARRAMESLELVGLKDFSNRRPKELSGGQQQRVALARAVAIRPRLLLLDEPLSSLDQRIRVQLRNELRQLQLELGLTGVYVTHDHAEALSLGDQVAVMDDGELVETGSPVQIFTSPTCRYTAEFLGTSNVVDLETLGQIGRGDPTCEGWLTQGQQPQAVAIRPEMVSLGPEGSAPLTGTIDSLEYQPGAVLGGVRIARDAHLKVLLPMNNSLSIGDVVGVNIEWASGLALWE